MPSFRRRRGVASSTPSPISTSTTVLPLAPPCIEDEKVSPRDTDQRPRKRKVIDGGDGISVAVDLSKVSPEIAVQVTVATLAKRGIGAASDVPSLEGFDVVASFDLKRMRSRECCC